MLLQWIWTCKVANFPSSVPERKPGVQSGPELPSWRWLQHMVNFHSYSLSVLCVNCYLKSSMLSCCIPSIVNFFLDCSTCTRSGRIFCTRKLCGRFDIKSCFNTSIYRTASQGKLVVGLTNYCLHFLLCCSIMFLHCFNLFIEQLHRFKWCTFYNRRV